MTGVELRMESPVNPGRFSGVLLAYCPFWRKYQHNTLKAAHSHVKNTRV